MPYLSTEHAKSTRRRNGDARPERNNADQAESINAWWQWRNRSKPTDGEGTVPNTSMRTAFRDVPPSKFEESRSRNREAGGQSPPQCRAWLLGEDCLLYVGGGQRSRRLIITAHGGYSLFSGTFDLNLHQTLKPMGPHGKTLTDPSLQALTYGKATPYATITRTAVGNLYRDEQGSEATPELATGTSKPGRFHNYSLGKNTMTTPLEISEGSSSKA